MECPPGIDAEQKEKNKENIIHRERHIVAQWNVMDFSTSSNALIQKSVEGLVRKMLSTFRGRTVGAEIQKKNNCLITCIKRDMIGDVDSKLSP